MNEILAKAVEELAKDIPNIAYVRGMLETVLAMNVASPHLPRQLPTVDNTYATPAINILPPAADEASMLDAKARAAIATVQSMQAQSQE